MDLLLWSTSGTSRGVEKKRTLSWTGAGLYQLCIAFFALESGDAEWPKEERTVSDIKENFIIVLYPERMVYGKLFYNSRYFHLGKDGYSIMGHNGEKIMIGDIFNARLTKVNVLNGEVVFSKGISEINEINHTENNRKRKVRRK